MNVFTLGTSVLALASLLLPMCIGIIVLWRSQPPSHRATLKTLGSMFLATAAGLALVGMAGALARGEQPFWPYLVMTGLPALAVAKIMQLHGIDLPGL